MSNKSEITLIVEAILANTRLIEMLIAKLPDTTKEAVAIEVAKVNPTPAPVVVQAPVLQQVSVPVPVVAEIIPTPAPAPTPAPVAVEAPAAGAPAGALTKAPFTTQKDMMMYVMGKYTKLGREKGAGIQTVLTSLGISNINSVDVSLYDALFTGIEAIV